MKRISLSILLTIAVALGLNAQGQKYAKNSKFDHKLEDKLKTGHASDRVPVIIQSHDVAIASGETREGSRPECETV